MHEMLLATRAKYNQAVLVLGSATPKFKKAERRLQRCLSFFVSEQAQFLK